ncbi:MAG: glutaredoxin family protein [Pirellulales bacterium]
MPPSSARAVCQFVAQWLQPAAPADHQVTLYTRCGCHLCDEAEEMLRKHGLQPHIRDIDSEPTLLAKYDTCVPVVEIDGRVRFRGRVDERLLRRLLKARPPSDGEAAQ